MKHVIIGNGPAGLVAAETLRRLQPDAEIALIGDESEPPYSRMAIPYFLIGKISDTGTHLRKSHDHYAKERIHLIEGKVVSVNAKEKQLEFASGERLPYDRLLIATGSHPLRPEVTGMDQPNVHNCWTIEDARSIAAKAASGSRVLQIGAGFIGCIIMEALAARGVKLTVVEMGDRMVPRMMTAKAGAMIKRWVEAKGVAVHCNAGVTRIEAVGTDKGLLGKVVDLVTGTGSSAGSGMKVSLSTGASLVADLVICAAGVKPNIDFLKGSGITVGRGIAVDAGMRTSVADIYAAGDVTEAPGFHTGQPELNAIQPNAADQARIAAHNMAGGSAASGGSLAINVLDTLGLISTSFRTMAGSRQRAGRRRCGTGLRLSRL